MSGDNIYTLMDQVIKLYLNTRFALFNSSNLHPRQMPFLGVLRDSPGATGKQLSETLNVAPSTVAVSLRRLESRGYVAREPVPGDSRSWRISLTREGLEIFDAMDGELKKSIGASLQGFSEQEIDSLAGYLSRMRENLAGFLHSESGENKCMRTKKQKKGHML